MSRMLILAVALLLAGGFLVFRAGGLPFRFEPAAPTEVSAAAAATAEAKIEGLNQGEEGRLNNVEVTSLLRYRPELWTFAPVIDPEVAFVMDTIRLTGSVLTEQLSGDPQLNQFRFLLPDTTRFSVAGTLATGAPGTATVRVARIEAVGMPIPPQFHPLILDRFGSDDALPPDAIALPLPAGIGSARVENGELIITP